MLKSIEQGNGFETLRLLIMNCQPTNRNRSLGLLQLLMSWPSFDQKVGMLPQVLKLEDSIKEYERITGGELQKELKFSILMKVIGGQLKTHLQLTLRDDTTYEQLRESIINYDQATIRLSSAMAPGNSVGKKMQLRWMSIASMEERARKEKERASRALAKAKERVIPKERVKMLFSLEKESQQMVQENQCSGPQIRTLGTRVGPKAQRLERTIQMVAKLLPKEKASVDLQGILLETAR